MENNKEVNDTNVGNIENDINRCKELIKDKHKEWIGMTNQKAIENVLNDYEKLQNKIKELENYINPSKARISYFDTKKGTNVVIEGFIPKQTIKDKIEKLKNELKFIACSKDCNKCFDKEGKALYRGSNFIPCFAYHQIKILQEILKESEEK